MEFVTSDMYGCVRIQRRAGIAYVFLHAPLSGNPVAFEIAGVQGTLRTARLLPHTTYILMPGSEYEEHLNALKTGQSEAPAGNPAPGPTEGLDASRGASLAGKEQRLHGKLSEIPPPAVAQVGGAHYQRTGVQHWDYACNLGYLEGQVSRYVDRYNKPGGYGPKDLLKSLSYLLKLLEIRYPERWVEHTEVLKDMQTRLADVYKAECSAPKRETVTE